MNDGSMVCAKCWNRFPAQYLTSMGGGGPVCLPCAEAIDAFLQSSDGPTKDEDQAPKVTGHVHADAFNEVWERARNAEATCKELQSRLDAQEKVLQQADQITQDVLKEHLDAHRQKIERLETAGLSVAVELDVVKIKNKDLEARLAQSVQAMADKEDLFDRIREAIIDEDDADSLYTELCSMFGITKVLEKKGCPVHDGQVHGAEASELRRELESLIKNVGDSRVSTSRLQRVLDEVDARDYLAHEELLRTCKDREADLLNELESIKESFGKLISPDTVALKTYQECLRELNRQDGEIKQLKAKCAESDRSKSIILTAVDQAMRSLKRSGDVVAFRGSVQQILNNWSEKKTNG